MFRDKNHFDANMERIMKKLDVLDTKVSKKEKVRHTVDGETLLDNQDVCIMLNVSKRTLQRYRSSGELPFKQIKRKTYYLDSDVECFIKEQFRKSNKEKAEQESS
ncbi:MAG: helix-turn-helix domain-containing protein [Prevotellaceae bacterium]|jgi:hypothetical protein|nr:helix-turn-helix domain-containing protein [Prevotellaceae bacterium]